MVAVKEASGHIPLMLEVLAECGDDLDVYSGDDHLLVPLMSMGAIGVISVLSNVIPAETAEMARLCLEGRTKEAADMQLRYHRLMNAMFTQVNPIPVKTAMSMMGWCRNEFRMPLCPMEPQENEKLASMLADYGLI
jgi:4-hydroxy-tetrahydrodipicolinate synthase